MTEILVSARPVGARVAATAAFLASGSCIGAWAASLPVLKLGLGLSASGLAAALFAFATGSILGLPSAGWLGKVRQPSHHDRRRSGFRRLPGAAGPCRIAPGTCCRRFLLGMSNGFIDCLDEHVRDRSSARLGHAGHVLVSCRIQPRRAHRRRRHGGAACARRRRGERIFRPCALGRGADRHRSRAGTERSQPERGRD